MNILLFDKSTEISKQIERNITSIGEDISVEKTNNMDETIERAILREFQMIIIDGDNLEGKFRQLADVVKKTQNNTKILIFFSFNIKSITEKFKSYGADYCFDKLCGFESSMETLKSIYDESNNHSATHGVQSFHKAI